eukprot:scaffold2893_cov254-Pinguiococcus_pyrenoidosus.AAC.17
MIGASARTACIDIAFQQSSTHEFESRSTTPIRRQMLTLLRIEVVLLPLHHLELALAILAPVAKFCLGCQPAALFLVLFFHASPEEAL